ncbi:MAG: peptide chain release factor N(5)-glutamine methyltransferase [Crocinitomicaceae bacterium]|nr:peptide chain release factor N(5)-glutamine methyltransferase [Crocinitomicaceae bacterium]
MFVQNNTGSELKRYVNDKLSSSYQRREIQILYKTMLCHRMQWEHADFLSNFTTAVFSESDLLFFKQCINRLLKKEPIQYILGETYFYNLSLKCHKEVLIPRPETEELVEWIIESTAFSTSLLIHDLCTGTGCIGLALKNENPNHEVFLSDISPYSIKLSIENKDFNHLNISVLTFDSLKDSPIDSFKENTFDIWVSNPPYIPMVEKEMVDTNVYEYEPHMALFVEDKDPICFYKSIADSGFCYLKPDGFLFFEINPNYAKDIIDYLQKKGYKNIELKQDISQKNRMLKAQKS